MIRVLFLTRQSIGGAATYAHALKAQLDSQGFEVVIDQAEDWIPEKTGWMVDRQVSRMVRDAGKGFDFVLAWGYRSAWACSEAFYLKKPWGYVAYDPPKTTHDQLIGRLGAARVGVCCSRSIKRVLDDADAVNLEVIVPGVTVPQGLPSQLVARETLGINSGQRLIVGMGRAITDSALDVFDDIIGQLKDEVPNIQGTYKSLGGSWKFTHSIQAPKETDPWVLLQAADLVFCPDRRAGFKMTAAMAMALGKPVVLRELSSLRELGVPEISLEFFEDDDDAYYKILDVLGAASFMTSLGEGARIRALEYLNMDRCGEQFAQTIRDSVGRR